jgi:hypothetical protein
MELLALAPTFAKGIVVVVAAFVLFVGSIYLLLSAVFGLRMAYLVLAVSFFGWMIIFSTIWVIGQPRIPPPIGPLAKWSTTGTLPNLGPRGTEPHWQVFAAGTGPLRTRYPVTARYPGPPWRDPTPAVRSSVDTAKTAIQKYLLDRADRQFRRQGKRVCLPGTEVGPECVTLDPTTFVVEDLKFATAPDGTHLAAAHAFFEAGGPEITVYAYHDSGNVQAYSWAFLMASLFGFFVHVPFLDRAEKKRKAILTGGTAPPWYGPA